MDKSRLAAKHKKALEWESFLSEDVNAREIKSAIKSNLATYRSLLYSVWESKEPSPDLIKEIEKIEQTLENLNEEIRLRVKRS